MQLAAMNAEELFALSPQNILDRFLASAGHLKGGPKESSEVALYTEAVGDKRKANGSARVCYNCNQTGHFKAQCPKLRKSGKSKKFVKNSIKKET
jgi:hypothetical protein